MIEAVKKTQCYSAFYSSNARQDAPAKVKIASLVGAGLGAFGAVYLISRHKTNKLKQCVSMFNMSYKEPEIMGVALSSVVGGFVAGSLTDSKKHTKAKVKECIHQAVANIISPLIMIGAINKLYSKVSDKICVPKFKPTNTTKKVLNYIMKITPNLLVTLTGLVAGVFVGTKVANFINGTNNTPNERKVKLIDFMYHPDDIATALTLSDNSVTVQKIASKVIPPIFSLQGYETGSKR